MDDPEPKVPMNGMKTMVPVHRAITRTAEVRHKSAFLCERDAVWAQFVTIGRESSSRSRSILRKRRRITLKNLEDKYHMVEWLAENKRGWWTEDQRTDGDSQSSEENVRIQSP